MFSPFTIKFYYQDNTKYKSEDWEWLYNIKTSWFNSQQADSFNFSSGIISALKDILWNMFIVSDSENQTAW